MRAEPIMMGFASAAKYSLGEYAAMACPMEV